MTSGRGSPTSRHSKMILLGSSSLCLMTGRSVKVGFTPPDLVLGTGASSPSIENNFQYSFLTKMPHLNWWNITTPSNVYVCKQKCPHLNWWTSIITPSMFENKNYSKHVIILQVSVCTTRSYFLPS